MAKQRKKRKSNIFLNFFIKILIIVAIIYMVLTFVLSVRRMSGNNMFPSIRDGDLCVFYKLEDSHLSDVVIYKDNDGKESIGRIVAIAGQTVDFPEAGGYLVNDYQPTEDITYQTYNREGSDISYPLKIEEENYYIMNDFRSNTDDSRLFGQVSKEQIEGKLIFILRRRGF